MYFTSGVYCICLLCSPAPRSIINPSSIKSPFSNLGSEGISQFLCLAALSVVGREDCAGTLPPSLLLPCTPQTSSWHTFSCISILPDNSSTIIIIHISPSLWPHMQAHANITYFLKSFRGSVDAFCPVKLHSRLCMFKSKAGSKPAMLVSDNRSLLLALSKFISQDNRC